MPARPFSLVDGEVMLKKHRAGYQFVYNMGTLYLTSRRLVWERGFKILFISKDRLELPLAAISNCWRQGAAVIVETGNGDFWFIFSAWAIEMLRGCPNVKAWVDEVTMARGLDRERQIAEGRVN
jgi:hypothetical protein